MKKLTKILLIGCISLLLAFGFVGCNKDCEHVYDNACDVTCNECNEERTITHTWKNADCTTPKTCTVCGATEGEALGHTWTNADCDTPKTCSVCGATDGNALGHIPETDDGDCATEVKCTVCGDVTTPAGQHTPNNDDGDCTTPITCSVCGTTTTPAKDNHTGGTATCTEKAKCTACGTAYGTVDANNHIDENTDHICDRECGKTDIGTHADSNTDHACDYGCSTTIGTHADTNNDHNCEYGCSTTIGVHSDSENDDDHTCDYGCGATLEDCKGGTATCTAQAVCTICGNVYGELDPDNHIDSNKDHICDRECGKTDIGTHEDTNNDHNCDYGCTTTIGTHSDSENDDDHTCDYGCGATLEDHAGGTATCSQGKLCDICGFEYDTTRNPNNHASDEFTYTSNTDGTTHTKKYKCCDAVADEAEAHTIKDHVCTACGAMELAVSFETYNHEWKTGDQIKLTSETEDENGNTVSTEYDLTATVADDGTVTWTPDKALYWNGTGKHNLYVTYPKEGQYDSFVIPADQSSSENLRKADLLNAMWSGDPTTDTITFNLMHRLVKIKGSCYIGSEFDGYTSFALKVYSNTQYLYFDGTTLERKDVAGEEGDGIWITPYLSEITSNIGTFTAYIAPGTYNTGEMLQFYVDGKLVSFTGGGENMTFGEGSEWEIGGFKIGKDKMTVEDVFMNDIDFPFGDGWSTEVNLDGSTGTIGTANAGKTAWAKDDQIIITLISPRYGKQVAVITYNGEYEYWSGDVSLSYLENETFTVTAVYAPSSTLGMGEYIPATTTIELNVLRISFESGRTYSRLRIVGLPNQTLTVTTTGFTPAGASAAADGTTYTVTTNGDGNAFLYGTFAEGATVSVKYGDVVLKDYTFTAEKTPNGTEQGKSYVLDARPVIDGTFGGKATATEDDIKALVEQIKTYVDNGISTIIVTGSNPAMITVNNVSMTAIGEAIYRLSGSGTHNADNQYNGKIDLILPDVTEIVDVEFLSAYALNSITLPKVTTVGNNAFYHCWYLQELTFGSVVTIIKSNLAFSEVGRYVDGGLCDLVLNRGQVNAAAEYQPDILSKVWWKLKWKNIELI